MATSNIQYPKTVGRLMRKPRPRTAGPSDSAVYTLNRRSSTSRKFNSVRNIQFTVRPLAENRFVILVGRERFDEAHSSEDIKITLIRAFDRECIKAGIVSATARQPAPPDEMAMFEKTRYDRTR